MCCCHAGVQLSSYRLTNLVDKVQIAARSVRIFNFMLMIFTNVHYHSNTQLTVHYPTNNYNYVCATPSPTHPPTQVITHLLNLLGHFPFSCGSAQMSSVVREYHDSPTFQHMHELSTEIFDSPRVQVF